MIRRNVIFERSKFNKRVQLENETVDPFVTDLHCMAEHCQFGDINKPFHGIFHHLESGHSSWNAHSDYTETAVKLFSQVYTAQNFQVNIWYYTSFYS